MARQGEDDQEEKYIEQAKSLNSNHEIIYYAKAYLSALQNNHQQAI
ncbi:MAG: hypothetical protein AAGF83_15570 [Cyanobacteria bacterium P01_G01_bin.67]